MPATVIVAGTVYNCQNCSRRNTGNPIQMGETTGCTQCTCSCTRCNKRYFTTDCSIEIGVSGNQRYCCEECSKTLLECNDCGHLTMDHSYRNLDDSVICRNCNSNYATCSHCSERYFVEDGLNCGCSDNYDEYGSTNSAGVYGCGYKPKPVFHGEPSDGLFFGVELEVEVVNNASIAAEVKILKDTLGKFVYPKQDGSIRNGFEIVTHPASLSRFKEEFGKYLDIRHTNLRAFSTDNCGLHIHVSRDPLVGLIIPRVMAFCNNKGNFCYIKKLAQRFNNNYCRVYDAKLEDIQFENANGKRREKPNKLIGLTPPISMAFKNQPKTIIKDGKTVPATIKGSNIRPFFKQAHDGRYQGVNIQNTHTVEFRLFKGTLCKETVFRYIEFCHALIKFCEPSTRPTKDYLSHEKFIEFVDSQVVPRKPDKNNKTPREKVYPYLAKFNSIKGPFNLELKGEHN